MNPAVKVLSENSAYSRLYIYMVASYFPLAFLDIRLPLPGLVLRLSDLYLAFLLSIFLLSGPDARRWIAQCLWLFVPLVLYIILYSPITGSSAGLFEAIQWALILCWIPICSYMLRQADAGTIRIIWLFILGIAVYTAISHIMQGHYYGFKHLAGAKYSFGFAALLGCLLFRRVNLILWFPLMVICVVLLALSDERKGMLFTALTIFGFVPLLLIVRSRVLIAGIFATLILLLICSGPILYYGLIRGNLDTTHFVDEEVAAWNSDLHRENLIANGVDMFLKNPLVGVGPKQLIEVMDDYYINPQLGLSTHNFYLDFLAEFGLIGILLFLLPTLRIVRYTRRDHPLSIIFLSLGFYCLCVPMFMETGTTTMITFFTGLACLISSGWREPGQTSSAGPDCARN